MCDSATETSVQGLYRAVICFPIFMERYPHAGGEPVCWNYTLSVKQRASASNYTHSLLGRSITEDKSILQVLLKPPMTHNGRISSAGPGDAAQDVVCLARHVFV